MKKMISLAMAAAFVLSVSTLSQARELRTAPAHTDYNYTSSGGGDNYVRGILGFTQGALNIGADYEKRSGSVGVGGYFIYGTEDKRNSAVVRHQIVAFGANAPIHLFNQSNYDVYMAPGVGIAMIKGGTGENDETTFGPTLKTGFDYGITPTIKAGLQYMIIANWFTDKTDAFFDMYNATMTFNF